MASDRRDPAGVYFGATSGAIFHTADAGDSWKVMAEYLPPVISLAVTL